MPQLEYKRVHIPPMGTTVYEKRMNELGAEGWDVNHIERTDSGGINVYLKREKGKYRISLDEYEYIQAYQEFEDTNVCQLCGHYNSHHKYCPAHKNNVNESGLLYCGNCGWIYENNHTNEKCSEYVEEEDE